MMKDAENDYWYNILVGLNVPTVDTVDSNDKMADLRKNILVVIISYNSCHLTQECINSVRAAMEEGTYKIVVVDNASTDGITEWLEEQEDILLIKNDENAGFGPACNQAVKATVGTGYEAYDVFLLNNDTRLTDNAVYFLIQALYSADDIGAVGSVSNYAGNRQQIDVLFDRVEGYLEYGRCNNVPVNMPYEYDEPPVSDFFGHDASRPMKEGMYYEERVRLSGFAMLIRHDAWDKVGGFDEDFAPGYFEDDALSMELMKNGYRLLLVKNSFIYHAGSQSFSKTDYNKLLEDHRELFIKKYGFDIIEYAYPDRAMLAGIPLDKLTERKDHAAEGGFVNESDKGDRLRILQIGSGLGADLKAVRGLARDCEAVGLETNKSLYELSRYTEKIFNSIKELRESYKEGYFDVLIIRDRVKETLSPEDKELIAGMCGKDAVILTGRSDYESFPYDRIKLIVWDLDDTLWKGILSEGEVELPESNIGLIKLLTDHGIVNSISSKNDPEPVEEELRKAGIWDNFVFNNINWDEKGSQIADKLKTMGLRAGNTLFIDDNPRNSEEAKSLNPGLMTTLPDIIPYLYEHYSGITARDASHKRLEQYRLLERKTLARSTTVGMSKEQFLYDSSIRITINKNCLEELDRIHEMVMRTNQLNFTKNRDNKDLLTRQITNDWNDCAYIRARDKFGDYGIVGFYCYNMREKVMEHFLFSCRVLGMGIEQYIYCKLGCPAFEIKEPVAAKLLCDATSPWVSEAHDEAVTQDRLLNNRVRILLKGPCDMSAIEPYLAGANITTEFNYFNEFGFVTTGQNHTKHIVESEELSDDEIDGIIKDAPFIIKGDFETRLFKSRYHVVCLSMLQDLASGLYRNKRTGHYISFSSKNYDLTAPENAGRFINKKIQGHDYPFTEEIISDFSDKWEFIGNTPIEMLLEDLDYIYDNIPGKPLIILLLGSEVDCEHNTEEFAGMVETYREINPVIEAFAEDHERIKVINATQFIHSQDDFADCINHYSRNVYYEIAGKICELINDFV